MENESAFFRKRLELSAGVCKTAAGAVLISNEADIKNSLEVLLSTRVGERIMQPKYGCNLDEMLFEPLTVGLQTYMKDLVFTAIYYFEPRVKPEELTLTAGTEGVVIISVQYLIRSTNTRHNLVYPFYLAEGTNVVRGL